MMRIGFDAKRAFFNFTGLGNYSRFVIRLMCKYYPQNQYVFYTPKTPGTPSVMPETVLNNVSTHLPDATVRHLKLHSLWRSWWMSNAFNHDQLDLFHGLSNEIPQKVNKNIPSLVTMHDLIFLRHPELYKSIDRKLYTYKYRKSCEKANGIIAISEQTKMDLLEFFHIPEDKIQVIYQGCNPIFKKAFQEESLASIRKTYNLPQQFMLNVGTIEARKNVLSILEGMVAHKIDMPLVVVGRATPYKQLLIDYIEKNNLKTKVIFLHNVPFEDLPGIYQLAELFIYPSIFEGFGIPILEALVSSVPVISSTGSCFAEAGGPHSAYVAPGNSDALGTTMSSILSSTSLRTEMIEKGLAHAEKFEDEKLAHDLMQYYAQFKS